MHNPPVSSNLYVLLKSSNAVLLIAECESLFKIVCEDKNVVFITKGSTRNTRTQGTTNYLFDKFKL